jgi:hypothetical protein
MYDEVAFENKINEYYENGQCTLVDGYAPFWFVVYSRVLLLCC